MVVPWPSAMGMCVFLSFSKPPETLPLFIRASWQHNQGLQRRENYYQSYCKQFIYQSNCERENVSFYKISIWGANKFICSVNEMWNWSLISCKSTGWSLAKRGRMFLKWLKTPKLRENVYCVMGQWCVQPHCQEGMGPCTCDAVVYVWHPRACGGRTWRGWNHPALMQEELRGRIQMTVQEAKGVGLGRGCWVRHEERVVRSLLNGDGGQRMAKRAFKDRNMYCGMLCHLTCVEYVTFSHDPPAFNRAGFV